jgi:hypothetical protein
MCEVVMLNEYVIGFDCREMWTPIDNARKHMPLLKEDIDHILTIDRETWHSVFLHPFDKGHNNETASGKKLRFSPEFSTSEGLWLDLKAMQHFLDTHQRTDAKPCVSVGFSVVQTPDYVDAAKSHPIGVPVYLDLEPSSAWVLLGYDVVLGWQFGRGLGYPWIEPYETERKKLWGNQLNQHYLFSDQASALDYANYHASLDRGLGQPLIVVGIYQIEKRPSLVADTP